MKLEGKRVTLRPMTLKERFKFFQWATRSDATDYWYGKLLGDDVPSYVVFKTEWPDHYFTEGGLYKGRCFVIEHEGKMIGQINYNEVHKLDLSTELDILIADRKNQGRGLGSEAIRLLQRYLFQQLGLRRLRMEVVSENPRALRAFGKAGFSHTYSYVREGIRWHVMEMLADANLPVVTPKDDATPSSRLPLYSIL